MTSSNAPQFPFFHGSHNHALHIFSILGDYENVFGILMFAAILVQSQREQADSKRRVPQGSDVICEEKKHLCFLNK